MGFAAPAWLAALGILLPLIWFYLRTRRRPPATVSSLVVWRVLDEPAVPRRRPRLPLLFFVQAALIVASVLALAEPFRKRPVAPGPQRAAVIVLDVSASMQAHEDGVTRFEQARAAAQERARELGARGRRLTVITAGLQPEVAGTQLEGARAADLIGELEPRDTAGNLTAAAELAATLAGTQGSIDVFTDVPADGLVMSRDARAISDVHRFGAAADNVAITGVRVVANPFGSSAKPRALVTLRSFAAAERAVTLTAEPLDEETGGGPPVTREVTLAPGATEVVSLDALPWSGPVRISLSPEDALALDDTVYAFVPSPSSLEVLLVTEDDALERAFQSLARSLGDVTVRTVRPVQYSGAPSHVLTVFDRTAPARPPSGNALYLAPPRGNPDVTVIGGGTTARLAEVKAHEIVAGLENPETMLRSGMASLAPSGTQRAVLLGRAEGREVPLVLAGETGGRRVVATAFPLAPAALRDADALPTLVFTINVLRWLAPAATDAPLTRIVGERLRAGSPDAAPISRLEGPGGARELAPADEVTLERAGVYRALGATGSRLLLVSFIDPAESDVARPETPPVAPAPPRASVAPAPATLWEPLPYVREALLVALLAMLVEWVVVAASGPRARREEASA